MDKVLTPSNSECNGLCVAFCKGHVVAFTHVRSLIVGTYTVVHHHIPIIKLCFKIPVNLYSCVQCCMLCTGWSLVKNTNF
jgi:hypothetical protein